MDPHQQLPQQPQIQVINHNAFAIVEKKSQAKQWAKYVNAAGYVMMFLGALNTLTGAFQILTAQDIRVPYQAPDGSQEVLVDITKGDVAKMSLLKLVGGLLLFAQGYFGHKMADMGIKNFRTFEDAAMNPAAYQKISDQNEAFKSKIKKLIIAQFILLIVTFIAYHVIAKHLIPQIARQVEQMNEEEYRSEHPYEQYPEGELRADFYPEGPKGHHKGHHGHGHHHEQEQEQSPEEQMIAQWVNGILFMAFACSACCFALCCLGCFKVVSKYATLEKQAECMVTYSQGNH